jgi:hypothetical protein
MGMIERAQAAVRKYRSDPNGFTKLITITSPDDSIVVSEYGMHARITEKFNSIGEVVNTNKAHVSISEPTWNAAGLVTRNADNECLLKDYKVDALDSNGVLCHYVVREVNTDDTLSLITLVLGDFE